jgi:cobalamin biosynthesis protein CbiG
MGSDKVMTRHVIAGIGCRSDCSAEAIVAILNRACSEAGCQATALAAPAFKADEPGLQLAARQLGLALILVEASALAAAQTRCVTSSARAILATGFASVAEGSALAATGGGRLILARIGGGGVTCALAEVATS